MMSIRIGWDNFFLVDNDLVFLHSIISGMLCKMVWIDPANIKYDNGIFSRPLVSQ